MHPFFACATLLASSPDHFEASSHRGVTYLVKIAGTNGLISTPFVRTLEDAKATVNFSTAAHQACKIDMVPHLELNGSLTSALDFSVGGASATAIVARSRSFSTLTYFKLSPQVQGGTKFIVVTSLQKPPEISGDELAISVAGKLSETDATNPFTSRHVQTPGATPRQVLYQVELSDATHVITQPRVRTLEGEAARVSQSGPGGSFDVQLLPEFDSVGKLATTMRITVNSEDVLDMVLLDTPKRSMTFRVVHEDHGLTTRAIPVTGRRRPRLKPDELLVKLTTTVVT